MTITPHMVKELRERTGVGMAKCKQALQESEGDIDLAIANLRKSGIASAVKKEGREANEGIVGFAELDETVALIEVNSETDFVAQNQKFQDFVKAIASEVAETKPASLEAFAAQKFSGDPSLTLDEYRSVIIQTLGENIQFRRIMTFDKGADKSFGIYSHMKGKIVVVVELQGANDEQNLARDIAMHIAAEAPEYLKPEDVPQNVVDNERDIARGQVKGKPENIIDKIVDGKMRAFYDKICLLHQKFVKDPSITIEKLVAAKGKESNKSLSLVQFKRWQLGGQG